MPGTTILKFTDPYEYQAAMCRAISAVFQTVMTGSGCYQAELMRIDLSLPRTATPSDIAAQDRPRCDQNEPVCDRLLFLGQ
jgi:hypothetical protein